VITATAPLVLRVAEFEAVDVPSDLLISNGQLDLTTKLQYQNYFSVEIGRSGVSLRARGLVGLIPVNDRVVLEVVPRFSIDNLSRLVEVSKEPIRNIKWFNRRYRADDDLYPSLVEIYAEALYGYLQEIQLRGFLRLYRAEEELSSTPHGRILVDRSIKRAIAAGVRNKVEIAWFQRTLDIPANRCLLHAVLYLAQFNDAVMNSEHPTEKRRVARMLNYCSQVLSGVSRDYSMAFLHDPIVIGSTSLPSQRTYYRPALELARAILRSRALHLKSSNGSLNLPSLLLDLPSIFERYIRNTLSNASENKQIFQSVLDGNRPSPGGARRASLFDNGSSFPANPDIVIMNSRNDCAAVVEVKYKPAIGEQPYRDDLEQTLVYGMAYKAPLAVVVQPAMAGQRSGWHELGLFRGMRVALHLIDLSSELKIQEQLLLKELKHHIDISQN